MWKEKYCFMVDFNFFILREKKTNMKMLLMYLSVCMGISVWTWTQKTFTDWSESYFLEWNTVKWVKSHTDSTGKQRDKLGFIWKYSFQWQGYHSMLVAKHCWKCLFLRINSRNKIFVSLYFPCHQPCQLLHSDVFPLCPGPACTSQE